MTEAIYIPQPGWGPGYYVCQFCYTARPKKFTCSCVPDFVAYCWPCKSRECGHQEELKTRWQEGRFHGVK